MMILKKDPRSPLRYAGGKSRGVYEISKFIPDGTKSITSPFVGGGRWNWLVQTMGFMFTVMIILNHL